MRISITICSCVRSWGADWQYGLYLGVDNVRQEAAGDQSTDGIAFHRHGNAADTYDSVGRFIYGGVQIKF